MNSYHLAAAAIMLLTLCLAAPAGAQTSLETPETPQTSEDAPEARGQSDYEAEYRHFRPEAERGNAFAQFVLGIMYTQGRGAPQDNAKAAKWYNKAAEQGHVSAQFVLGDMYEQGRGVPQNDVLAHMWFTLSAKQGLAGGNTFRDRLERRMTSQQINEAQRLAREWKRKDQK